MNKENNKEKKYKHTLSLPETNFPMKADLSSKEKWILKYWKKIKLSERQKLLSGEKFTLHDGPPYANGHIHIGTALNKILKDMILKYQRMFGKSANYVPGWDCHGLPIEWSVEKLYLEEKKSDNKNNVKEEISGFDFRKRCRDFASRWVDIQNEEFQSLGVHADWENPYLTMDRNSEVKIVQEIHKFLMNDLLYSSDRTVMWSIAEKTSLADAEIEYKDITSKSVYVGFPINNLILNDTVVSDAKVVIWTTTPWTIPGNRAIAFNSRITYGLYNSLAGKLVLSCALAENFEKDTNIKLELIKEIYPGNFICSHPLRSLSSTYDFEVLVLKGDFVNDESGSGFVHVAPSHGEDDFNFAKENNINIPDVVDEAGFYCHHVDLVSGNHIFKDENKLIDLIKSVNLLFGEKSIVHSYPHSWRSKQKLIFRNTKQWFVNIDKEFSDENKSLRQKALESVENDIQFFPKGGKRRLYSMLENRPDWLISRQRSWGVPIAIFVEKSTGLVLKDKEINENISKIINELGIDAWFDLDNDIFLDSKYNPDDYEKVTDIVDVWFESGCTHSFVLQENRNLSFPADLYLEGSDQHRGWFQSSLLESCGTTGIAPYKSLLTHGFVLDKDGYKMSKSLGNTILPQEIISEYGADILRLWVLSSDFTKDVRISDEIVKSQIDVYRRVRNTFRYILSNINDFSEDDSVQYVDLPNLEKWLLNQIAVLHKSLISNLDRYDLYQIYVDLHNFCNKTLSAFYFDIRKFSIYCDAKDSLRRRSCQTVLKILADFLFKWYAPILSFTCEEVWMHFIGDFKDHVDWECFINRSDLATDPLCGKSIHLERFGKIGQYWEYVEIDQLMNKFFDIKEVVNCAVDKILASGEVKSKLDLSLDLYLDYGYQTVIEKFNLSELLTVSQCRIFNINNNLPEDAFRLSDKDGIIVVASKANGIKCERCLTVFLENVFPAEDSFLCSKCKNIINIS